MTASATAAPSLISSLQSKEPLMSAVADEAVGPDLVVLGLGAGIQSTTLGLMAARGELPKPDVAIFADTHWEPREVYEHLDLLEKALERADIPLLRVSRGDLRKDILDPFKQAAVPYHTLEVVEVEVPASWKPCPHPGCGWAAFKTWHVFGPVWDDDADDEVDAWHNPMEMRRLREEEMPDLCPLCIDSGRVVEETRTELKEKWGLGPRRCTGRYKVEPIERKIRELLGAPINTPICVFCEGKGERVPPWDASAGVGPCSVCFGTGARRVVGSVPEGKRAEQWIGFSADETMRVNDSHFPRYITPRYPLIELGMDRPACERWLKLHWKRPVAKSACAGCPLHGNKQWRELREHHPEAWLDAVAFDAEFRHGSGMRADRFLHASRVPLSIAPIDKVTPGEWLGRRLDVFDALGEIDLENGDPDGCSPYGCRSGLPVVIEEEV